MMKINNEYDSQWIDKVSKATVKTDKGCIELTKYKCRNGYGVLRYKGKTTKIVRKVIEILRGPIPPGMFVCHACDNPPCINPDHLWLGTPNDNVQDSIKKGRRPREVKTHCVNGHEFTEETTRHNCKGLRECAICRRIRQRRYRKIPQHLLTIDAERNGMNLRKLKKAALYEHPETN